MIGPVTGLGSLFFPLLPPSPPIRYIHSWTFIFLTYTLSSYYRLIELDPVSMVHIVSQVFLALGPDYTEDIGMLFRLDAIQPPLFGFYDFIAQFILLRTSDNSYPSSLFI